MAISRELLEKLWEIRVRCLEFYNSGSIFQILKNKRSFFNALVQNILGSERCCRKGHDTNSSEHPVAPFFPALDAEQFWRGSGYWTQFCDFARLPHLLHFTTVAGGLFI